MIIYYTCRFNRFLYKNIDKEKRLKFYNGRKWIFSKTFSNNDVIRTLRGKEGLEWFKKISLEEAKQLFPEAFKE